MVLQNEECSGFSLIELLAVLSIAAILLAIGVPIFSSLIQSQQLTTTANELFAAINLARSEAIERGTRVDLVPAGNGTDWKSGWVVFIDQNNNQKPDPGEHVIYSHGPASKDIDITSKFTDKKAVYLAYTGSGRTRTNANGPQSGSFLFTLGNQARRIVVNFLGRPRVCNPATESTCTTDM
jgi:type IV fimbrial biogenesis protein FimT